MIASRCEARGAALHKDAATGDAATGEDATGEDATGEAGHHRASGCAPQIIIAEA